MTWTAVQVLPSGVVLFDEHLRRLAPAGERILDAFRDFAATAAPGNWALSASGDELRLEKLGASTLTDGAPTRVIVSPYAERVGCYPKPARPSRYHQIRVPGVVSLLSSHDGRRLYESCSASLVGWDGARLVLVPEESPRVDATTERFLASHFDCIRRPILLDSTPLIAVNAVKGTCSLKSEREAFPEVVRRRIDEAFAASARRG